MSGTLFKEVGYSLAKLIEDIDVGEIGLPDIQRPFVWTPSKVRDLFDSMYKGFPVGYLLFWSNGAAEGARMIGADGKQKAPRLLIVDGQQRLTSLYAVIKGKPIVREDYSTSRIYIAFRPRDAKFEVADAAIRRDPEFIPDTSEIWNSGMSLYGFTHRFIERLRQNTEITENEEDQLSETISRLHSLVSYPFTALELSSSLSEEQVADVFVRINSKGVTLNQADFILTLMSVFWDEGRTQLERFCRGSRKPVTSGPSPFNYFVQPDPDQLLRVTVALAFRRARLEHVYSLLRGKDLESGHYNENRRSGQFEELESAQAKVLDLNSWHSFHQCLVRAGYRSGAMISSKTGLLYAYAFFLIGKRDFGVEPHKLRNIIARWFFFTSLTGRYSGSPESVMEEDLARIRGVNTPEEFIAALESVVQGSLTEDFWSITLPNELVTSAARSPSLYAYYAALNLLDAKVLFSKMRVSEMLDPAIRGSKSALERHHLFPRNYLRRMGITEIRETNQAANFGLIEWTDNIDIADSPPTDYVPKYLRERSLDSEDLRMMYYWHALPEGWEHMDYHEFLSNRRKLMADVIRVGFNKLTTEN